MSTFTEARPALALGLQLGEGLHWSAAEQRLWFVDIHGRRVFRWDLLSPAPESWLLDQRVGWVLPMARYPGEVLLGLQEGFARARLGDTVALRFLARPFGDLAALRLNDAKADRTGAVWAGSVNNDDESRPDGRLFRLGVDGSLSERDAGYCVCNGPAIHPDEPWLLHTDSARRTIYRFGLDADGGRLHDKQVWKVFADGEGHPDGMSFDAEGCVWVAHWGGACISRFTPDGRLLRRVPLPTSHVTNVCFGGAALDRLFVSTAWHNLSPERRASEPLAGALFEVDSAGVRGLPGLPFGG